MLIKYNNYLISYDKVEHWIFFRISKQGVFCCQYDWEDIRILNFFIDFIYQYKIIEIFYKFTTNKKSSYYLLNLKNKNERERFLPLEELKYLENNNFEYYCKIYIYISHLK